MFEWLPLLFVKVYFVCEVNVLSLWNLIIDHFISLFDLSDPLWTQIEIHVVNLHLVNRVSFGVVARALRADYPLVPTWLDKVCVLNILLADVISDAFVVERLPARATLNPSPG